MDISGAIFDCYLCPRNPICGLFATLNPCYCRTMSLIELKSLNFSKEVPVYLNFEY